MKGKKFLTIFNILIYYIFAIWLAFNFLIQTNITFLFGFILVDYFILGLACALTFYSLIEDEFNIESMEYLGFCCIILNVFVIVFVFLGQKAFFPAININPSIPIIFALIPLAAFILSSVITYIIIIGLSALYEEILSMKDWWGRRRVRKKREKKEKLRRRIERNEREKEIKKEQLKLIREREERERKAIIELEAELASKCNKIESLTLLGQFPKAYRMIEDLERKSVQYNLERFQKLAKEMLELCRKRQFETEFFKMVKNGIINVAEIAFEVSGCSIERIESYVNDTIKYWDLQGYWCSNCFYIIHGRSYPIILKMYLDY